MNKTTKQVVCDLVVIGSGAGGMMAALAAYDAGIQNIIILEKLHVPGGNTLFPSVPIGGPAGGLPPEGEPNSQEPPPKDRMGFANTPDEMFQLSMEWSHWRNDAAIVRALVDRVGEIEDFLQKHAAPDIIINMKTRLPQLIIPTLSKYGIPVWTDTAARHLRKNKDNVVTGVYAEGKECNYEITAQAVVMATGGFVYSDQYMERFFHAYSPKLKEELAYLGMRHTGDGIAMAEEIGGNLNGTVAFEWEINRFPWARIGSSSLVELVEQNANPEVLWVDKKGHRFTNESDGVALNAIYTLQDKMSYTIFDETMKQKYYHTPPRPYVLEDIGPNWREKCEEELIHHQDLGHLIVTDSLEKMAEFIGCDPKVLEDTINQYNSFCDKGHDDLFLKDPRYLRPIRQPPYYCVAAKLGILLTRGPLKVNSSMALLDNNYDPIPGIFCAGVDIGGTDTDTYCCPLAAHSFRWALTSGRIAGESAAKSILQQNAHAAMVHTQA